MLVFRNALVNAQSLIAVTHSSNLSPVLQLISVKQLLTKPCNTSSLGMAYRNPIFADQNDPCSLLWRTAPPIFY